MITFTQKQIVNIRQFGIVNHISALKYSLGKEVTACSSPGAGRFIWDIRGSVNWIGKWKDHTALGKLNWEEQWGGYSVHQNQTLLCRQKQGGGGGGGWVCVMCPFHFPVNLCSPWDSPVHLLGGWALQQVFVHSCLLIPAGGSEGSMRSRGNATWSFPIKTWPGFTFPASGNNTFRTFSSAATVN